jgi:hypothetical protein
MENVKVKTGDGFYDEIKTVEEHFFHRSATIN